MEDIGGHVLIDLCFTNAIYITLLAGGAWLKEHYLTTSAQDALLARVAHLDGLTGIANRRALDQTLRQTLVSDSRRDPACAVILLDIDWFKQVNDTFGHAVGDQVLIDVANVLRQHLRTNDTVGRWGGEEFLIIAPATDAVQAQAIAERVRAGMAQSCSAQGEPVTASFGIAIGHPADTAESLMQRADTALYHAKHRGRNRVEPPIGWTTGSDC